jgi:hypothetical protein
MFPKDNQSKIQLNLQEKKFILSKLQKHSQLYKKYANLLTQCIVIQY